MCAPIINKNAVASSISDQKMSENKAKTSEIEIFCQFPMALNQSRRMWTSSLASRGEGYVNVQ